MFGIKTPWSTLTVLWRARLLETVLADIDIYSPPRKQRCLLGGADGCDGLRRRLGSLLSRRRYDPYGSRERRRRSIAIRYLPVRRAKLLEVWLLLLL
jgi:hypothetical protein